ncbi:MAG TPA: hypothetical protein VGO64_11450, partial [Candidatus Limnocylindrales bacterium]|nr:hypothetical protein [Candidatus Limnocylindrales bacterium]
MTADPRAFFAVDIGAATTSAALIGRLAHRWRLVGSLAVPSPGDVDAIATELVRRVHAADPDLAARLRLAGDARTYDPAWIASDLPRLVARSAPARSMLVVAVSRRGLERLETAARQTGWRTTGITVDDTDPLSLTAALLDPTIDVLLVGAGDPPGADERRQLGQLAAIVAGAVARRPELTVVLAGAMAAHLDRVEAAAPQRHAEILLAPAANSGQPVGEPLRRLLDEIRGGADDPRRAAGPATAALADVLNRRIELIEIGFDGGLRATASPGIGGGEATARV